MPTAETDRRFEAPELIEVMEEAVRYNRFLIEALSSWFEGAGPLLDFGAGNGRFCIALQQRGHPMYAVEADRDLRRAIGERGVGAHEALDSFDPTLRFGGIYAINVLEHIEDDGALMRSFLERLVPGGRLLAYVPAFNALYSANDARVGHLRRYRRADLFELAGAAGFGDVKARYVDSLGFFAGLGYRFFGNRDGGLDVTAVRFYDRAVFPLSRLLDRVCEGWLGKNLLLTGVRPR